ncbi:MAG: hypothetical protein K9M03_04470 [Kiritimatiellales bacterium]|nr:hypothetical protein [Kiritimatiellales bacterium]
MDFGGDFYIYINAATTAGKPTRGEGGLLKVVRERSAPAKLIINYQLSIKSLKFHSEVQHPSATPDSL